MFSQQNSLTYVAHHSEQQQQLEQRYISAAAAVDAALMGDVHGNSSKFTRAGAGIGGADIHLEPTVAKKP
jgi:hypothetical protein